MSTEDKVPESLKEANEIIEAERKAKKEMEERAIGAEKVIENHKKKEEPKPKGEPEPKFGDEDMNRILDEREFFKANPDMVEYKDKLAEYTKKGNSLAHAKVLLEMDDETIKNRKIANKIDFTTGKSGVVAKTMTQEELSKLPPAEFKKAIEMRDSGEVKII